MGAKGGEETEAFLAPHTQWEIIPAGPKSKAALTWTLRTPGQWTVLTSWVSWFLHPCEVTGSEVEGRSLWQAGSLHQQDAVRDSTEPKSQAECVCMALCNPMGCSSPGSFVHGGFPGENPGVGCHFLLQGVFPTQGLNRGLLHLLH